MWNKPSGLKPEGLCYTCVFKSKTKTMKIFKSKTKTMILLETKTKTVVKPLHTIELSEWLRIYDPYKKMQANNRELFQNFYFGIKYNTKTRGVVMYKNLEAKEVVTYYARLYNTHIAKRSTADNKLYITHGGWPTRTTTKAINAILPVGWSYSRQTLISPNKTRIEVTSNWVLVEEPVNQYAIRSTI